jgi:hypothetical protein
MEPVLTAEKYCGIGATPSANVNGSDAGEGMPVDRSVGTTAKEPLPTVSVPAPVPRRPAAAGDALVAAATSMPRRTAAVATALPGIALPII